MRETIGYQPPADQERDCPCGRYPDGDCSVCRAAQAEASYEANLRKQIKESRREDMKHNKPSQPVRRKMRLEDFPAYKEVKKKYGPKPDQEKSGQ